MVRWRCVCILYLFSAHKHQIGAFCFMISQPPPLFTGPWDTDTHRSDGSGPWCHQHHRDYHRECHSTVQTTSSSRAGSSPCSHSTKVMMTPQQPNFGKMLPCSAASRFLLPWAADFEHEYLPIDCLSFVLVWGGQRCGRRLRSLPVEHETARALARNGSHPFVSKHVDAAG